MDLISFLHGRLPIVIIYDTERHADPPQLTRKCAKLLRQLLRPAAGRFWRRNFLSVAPASGLSPRYLASGIMPARARPSQTRTPGFAVFHVLPFFLSVPPRFSKQRTLPLVEFRVFFLRARCTRFLPRLFASSLSNILIRHAARVLRILTFETMDIKMTKSELSFSLFLKFMALQYTTRESIQTLWRTTCRIYIYFVCIVRNHQHRNERPMSWLYL